LFLGQPFTDAGSAAFGACHEGAAIEGLCPTGERLNDTASSYTTFYHNVTSSADSANAQDSPGVVNWILHAAGNLSVPSAMSIYTSELSNVGVPIFAPGPTPYSAVSFDECGKMYIETTLDDTVSPPEYVGEGIKVYNWYVCLTQWSYLYTTLVWQIGRTGEPQNPSCQAVNVTRVFVGDE
jgi:hypothetical protein